MRIHTQSDKKISIVMLTYNNCQELKACMTSILPVLAHDIILELIIFDNNSNETTREYIQTLTGINKIQIIFSDKNLGVTLGRIKLFAMAKGDIIASLDSDILLTDSHFFYKAINVLTTNINVGICGMSGYFVDFSGDRLNLKEARLEGIVHCVSGCCQIFWNYLLDSVFLDTAFSPFWCEDTDFCFQIIEQQKLVYYIPPDYGLHHDYHSKNSRKNDPTKIEKEKYLVNKWKDRISFNKPVRKTIDPSYLTLKLWILKLRDSTIKSGFDRNWYPEHCILTPDNIHNYLPEIQKNTNINPVTIQLLLLFKYGGICIDYRYIHIKNIFKYLIHQLSDKNVDLILLKYQGKIMDDIIVGKKGSTLIHKCLVCKKIEKFETLVNIFGNKCMIIDDFIGSFHTDNNISYKLIKGDYDKPELMNKRISSIRNEDQESISFFEMPGYTMNPCAKSKGEYYYLIVRNESSIASPLTSNVKNILYCMDQQFKIIWKKELRVVIGQHSYTSRNRKKLSDTDFVIEDIRFIENTTFANNKIYVYGSAMIDYEKKYLTKIALFELDIINYQLTFLKFLNIQTHQVTEKNWLIFYHNLSYYIIYTIDPLKIYECSPNFNEIKPCHTNDYRIRKTYISDDYDIINNFLHLSSMVTFNQDYYFILYRFYTYNSYYTGQQKRVYRNYGALMHKQTFRLDYFLSEDLFSNYSHNIIIANSAKKIGNSLFFFCGFDDELSGYIKLNIDYIKSKLICVSCEQKVTT